MCVLRVLTNKKTIKKGAGPSGLVTAKTLLHEHPRGTFLPVVFDQREEPGGLWPSQPSQPNTGGAGGAGSAAGRTLDPLMRTNLSRFTVAFSDLAWESVSENDGDGDYDDEEKVPMFPHAWQVGKYLVRYAERFLYPHGRDIVRLGQRVIRTTRETSLGRSTTWTVEWVPANEPENGDATSRAQSERFDYLVVASGYFSSPWIPDIPGLDGVGEQVVVHSSSLHGSSRDITSASNAGDVVVIGGSLSGAEAASKAALNCSTVGLDTGKPGRLVHHVSTRPFWSVPTYLPLFNNEEGNVSLVPLDLVFYDLSRRPPGSVEYATGPISTQRAQKMDEFFYSVLGSEYAASGKVGGDQTDTNTEQSPNLWVAIGNDYAEYVRSGAVSTTIGRVAAVHRNPNPDLVSVDVSLPDGDVKTLNNIAAIVMATGFTPYKALSFLPEDVLSTLEYSENNPFSPLLLDGMGTSHADIPDLGFVGFYRGPYWGAMEMQARFLARNWAQDDNSSLLTDTRIAERQRARELRSMDCGQFPMGDYVGLMESFARDLEMSRVSVSDSSSEQRTGPVFPARYTQKNQSLGAEAVTTLESLQKTLLPGNSSSGAPLVVFCALHGTWGFSRQVCNDENTVQGTAVFRPHHSTNPLYEKEYVYEEQVSETPMAKSIYRFPDLEKKGNSRKISVCPVDTPESPYELHVFPAERDDSTAGCYTICASTQGSIGEEHGEYRFHFQGVAIVSWEHVGARVKTMYKR